MNEGILPILAGIDTQFEGELFGELLGLGVRAFLLPGRLLFSPRSLATVTKDLRDRAEAAGIPRILLALGPGAGFLPPLPAEPTPLALAALARPGAARRAGVALGALLASAGVDMVMTPHVDVVCNPKHPCSILDSFGEDIDMASRLCSLYIEGIRSESVAVCAMGLPCGVVHASRAPGLPSQREETASRERVGSLRILEAAIRAGLDAVVTGAASSACQESAGLRVPVTTPPQVNDRRLREEMHFQGLLIAEDPTAAAAGRVQTQGKGYLPPGFDMVLIRDTASALASARTGLKADTPTDTLFPQRFYALMAATRPRSDVAAVDSVLHSGLYSRVGKERLEACSVIKDNAIFDGSRNPDLIVAFLPGSAQEGRVPESMVTPATAHAVLEELAASFPEATILCDLPDPDPESASLLADRIVAAASQSGQAGVAAVLTYNAHLSPAQEATVRMVAEAFPAYSVIAMLDPYDLAFFPDARGLAATFGLSAASARMAAALLSGHLRPRASIPLRFPGSERESADFKPEAYKRGSLA